MVQGMYDLSKKPKILIDFDNMRTSDLIRLANLCVKKHNERTIRKCKLVKA